MAVLAAAGPLSADNVTSRCSIGNIHSGDVENFTGGYKLTPKQTTTSP